MPEGTPQRRSGLCNNSLLPATYKRDTTSSQLNALCLQPCSPAMSLAHTLGLSIRPRVQPSFHSGLLRVQVKSDVLSYCNLDPELGCFQLPQPFVLAGYRVIICTCAAAGENGWYPCSSR